MAGCEDRGSFVSPRACLKLVTLSLEQLPHQTPAREKIRLLLWTATQRVRKVD
jgi:hypothetical protein